MGQTWSPKKAQVDGSMCFVFMFLSILACLDSDFFLLSAMETAAWDTEQQHIAKLILG